ncbi:PREDICTED: histone-lysine N-methyltransferase, H3 lysine-79 specific [Nicrophorus vespilloides]|uniref:Histone-lysine N-methyltransferase, H3 lysine-79 specific n=1 Tax=Nicrophorus vespilloides TaxID=110193 RepID=A0ABM1N5F9_NICVS|nr:PREDICTED: histone-lysine N-methyltransferase, H3 lysine-79 specific [Nicrophorus vespilloides]
MSTTYDDIKRTAQSLIERKKLQWAREREELAGLCENVPWGSRESLQLYDKPYLRSKYASKYQKENEYVRRDSFASSQGRPSLPPLYKNQNVSYTSDEKLDKEMGGETSGYGSDNPNQTPEYLPPTNWNNHHLGYESSSSGREDRPKWRDRGVHVGKFWEPKEVQSFLKSNDTPGWVKRGLDGDTELVVSNNSPAESPEQDYLERPCTGSSSSQTSYIRGQNIRVEPSELAERERKRQIALAHQEAIKQQLEERERKRQEEKVRKIREEYEEEARIAREQDLERKRQEQENRIREEKLERERRRKEALQEAIEIAEKEAKQAKQKLLKQNLNIAENVVEVDKLKVEVKKDKCPVDKGEIIELPSIHAEKSVISNNNKDNNIEYTKEKVSQNIEMPPVNNDKVNNNQQNNNNNNSMINLNQQLSQENLALMLQNPLESLHTVQFAVLIPTINPAATGAVPVAVPLTDRGTINTARTENRILTPTQYRNKRMCDSSTQTDFTEFKQEDHREKYVREKLSNLEISYEGRCRKERRSRSEFRENVEDRPKWGVNRPPTRYLKQSEKDPLYQRRKMRQKMRQMKGYEDKCRNYSPHSSDDSQTGSPRTYRKKGYAEKQSRALWRKNEHVFAENVRVYQTEIVPIESDKDHIYFKTKTHQCCCRCKREREKYTDQLKVVDILKIEHNSPRECLQYKNDLIEDGNKLPDFNGAHQEEGNDVLEKLNLIHHGLMLKHEHWDDTPSNSMSYSPSRHP